MRKTIVAIAIGLCVLGGGQAWALPTGAYDAVVSEGDNDYTRTFSLGTTLDFDYWFETTAAAGSYIGQAWDVMVLQTIDGWTYLGQVGSYYSSSDWQSASLAVPSALQGQEREVRFHVDDFGPATDPVVYLRNLPDGAPVPEPSSMLLIGSGLAGLLGFGLRKKTA